MRGHHKWCVSKKNKLMENGCDIEMKQNNIQMHKNIKRLEIASTRAV